MKRTVLLLSLFAVTFAALAQEEEEEQKPTFKENLFTGGSVSLAFFNNTFLIGASPVFGYSLTNWADAGIVLNYNYTSYRDVELFDDRLRQTQFGGGAFVKLYPVRFLFAQAQLEQNSIRQKYLPPGNAASVQYPSQTASSFLVGGGYTSGRFGRGGAPFYYLAILFDVSGDVNSPYTDAYGRSIPIIRAGFQIPLFQGGGNRENR
jgi:hypothetical protein